MTRQSMRVGGRIKRGRLVQAGMTYSLGQGLSGQVWSAAPASAKPRGFARGRGAWLVVRHANGSPNRMAIASICDGRVVQWHYVPTALSGENAA